MADLTLAAPAKINLFLRIVGRRADGYHQLQTLFQLLDLCDTLEFTRREDAQIKLHCDHPQLANEPFHSNLVYRAASLLQTRLNTPRGIDIRLHKTLPLGGGLGGGSSDAATTLIALNHLWQLNLSHSELMTLGGSLGADVPVFIFGQTAWAEGIGEQLQAIALKPAWYLIIQPGCHVNTGEIFSHPQLTRDAQTMTIADFLARGGPNDCQSLVRRLYPEIDNALIWLDNFAKAQLTGTGACIFARFDSRNQAQAVYEQLPAHLKGYVAQGINRSPVASYADATVA